MVFLENLLKYKIYEYNPKPLKQIASENIERNDKQLDKELADKMPNPYYFTDRVMKIGVIITLDSHHNNHANSNLSFRHNFPEIGIDIRYIIKNLKRMAKVYARILDHYKFKYQVVLLNRFDKKGKDDQILDEIEMDKNLS